MAKRHSIPTSPRASRLVSLWPLSVCLLLSGAGSLALETVWLRRLELVFGSTTLAISTVLAAYMLGLGLGSLIGGRVAAVVPLAGGDAPTGIQDGPDTLPGHSGDGVNGGR